MKDVRVVALMQAKPGHEKYVEDAVTTIVAPSRAENGNISYSANVDSNNPLIFIITEHWENLDFRNAHLQSEHFKNLQKATDGEQRLDLHTFHLLHPLA